MLYLGDRETVLVIKNSRVVSCVINQGVIDMNAKQVKKIRRVAKAACVKYGIAVGTTYKLGNDKGQIVLGDCMRKNIKVLKKHRFLLDAA